MNRVEDFSVKALAILSVPVLNCLMGRKKLSIIQYNKR